MHGELFSAQQYFYVLSRPSQNGAIASLDDGPLNQIRMLDHQGDDFVIAEVFLAQTQLSIDRFAGAEQVARLDAHLLDQLSQFLCTQRLEIIVDLAEVDAALTEQLVQLATFRSSWFLVDCDFVFHNRKPDFAVAGKMPAYRTHGCVRSVMMRALR